MGEAKRRGTYEERKAQAIERKKQEHLEWQTARQARQSRRNGRKSKTMQIVAAAAGLSAETLLRINSEAGGDDNPRS